MLSSISWSEYFITLLITLFFYYIAIGLLFFRADIVAVLNRNSSILKNERSDIESPNFDSIPHELLGELNTISENSYKNKEELLTALRGQLNSYRSLQNKATKNSITEFLHDNYPQLDETDIKRVWN